MEIVVSTIAVVVAASCLASFMQKDRKDKADDKRE
jgi:hypothetical protein